MPLYCNGHTAIGTSILQGIITQLYCLEHNKKFLGMYIPRKIPDHCADCMKHYNNNKMKNTIDLFTLKKILFKKFSLPFFETLESDGNGEEFRDFTFNSTKLLEKYKELLHCKFCYKTDPSNNIIISVHIRRDDILNIKKRYLNNNYYIEIVEKIHEIIPEQKTVYIFSDSEINIPEFTKFNCVYFINTSIEESFDYMINSDILIISRSSFSYLPAIFNKNIVIYHPFWHSPFSNWLDSTSLRFQEKLKDSINHLKIKTNKN